MSMGILWGWRWWRLLVLLLVTCSRSEVDSLSNTAGSVMQGHGCYKARHVVILGTKVMARNELYEKDMASCEKACIENANCTAWSYKLPKEMKFLKIPEPPDLEEQLSAGFDDNDSSCYLVYKDDLIENLTMRYSFGATLKFKECSEVYVGCLLLEDNPGNATLANSSSTHSCLLDCKESNNAYAGLKNASGCVCGNAFGDGKFVDNSQCQIPCPTAKNDLCGGKNATSIWRTGTLGTDDACIFGPVSFVNFSGEIFREYSIGHCVFHCNSQDNCVAWQHNGTHCSLFTDDLDEVKLSVGMEGIIAGFGNCYDNLKLMYHTMIELPVLTVQIFNGTIEASHLLSENGENITLWEPDTSNQATGRFLTQAWMSKDRSGVPQILSTWDAPNFFNQHPSDFSLIWTKNGTTFWKPVCPPKYTALGSVSTNAVSEIPSKNFSICLHESVVKETQTGKKVRVQNESGDSVYIFDVFHNDSALPSLSSFIATRSGNHSNPLLTLRKVAQDAAVPTRYAIHAKHKGIFDTKLSTHIHLLSLSVITSVTRNVSSNRTRSTYHMKHIFVGFLSQEDLDHDWTSSGTQLSYNPIRSIRVFRRQKGEGITPPKGFESIGTIGVHIGKIDHSRDPDKLHIIRLICPDGFHALGVVALLNDTVFNSSHYSCIHEKFLVNVSLPKKPWWPVYAPLHNVSLWGIYPASCFEDYLAHSLATMGSERPSDTAFMLRKHKEGDYEECSSFSYQVANMKTNIRRMERQRRLRLQRAGSSSGWGRTQYSHSGGAGFTWLGGQGGETTGLHEYGEEGISFDGVMGESEQSSTFEVEKTKVTYRSRSDAASRQNGIDIPDLRIVSEVRTLLESSAVRTTHQVSTPRPLEITDQVTSEPLSGITAEMVLKGWACFQMRHFAFYATPIDAADINGIRYKDVCVSKCRRNGECLAWSYILDKYDKNGNVLGQSQCHHLLGDNDISNLKIVFVKDAFMEFLTCDLGYIGCFKDAKRPRDLPNPEKGNRWTADTCQEACALKGYAYFGLQFGGECWCGNSFGKYRQHSSDSACSIKCRAKPTETCGSMDMNSLYRTGNINGEMCLFAKASLEYRNLESANFNGESIHDCWGRCKSGASGSCVMWEHNGTHCHHISQSHLIDSGQIRLRPSNLSYVGFRSCDTPTGTQFYRTNSSMEMSVKLTHDVTDDVTITTDEKENLTVYSTSLQNLANEGYFLLGQSFRNSTYVAKIFSGEPLQTPNDMHEVLVEHVSVVNRNQTTADRGPGAFASFWHTDCPSGYSALGDVISPEVEPPNPQHYKCVHNDFLHAASIGEKIWARTEPDEISLWHIAPKTPGADPDLSFFKVTDHAASIKDDELFLKILKKVANEDGEYYYTAQDTFEFESKLSDQLRDFNIFSDGERNGGNIRISKQANLEDGWFYLGFGQPLTTDGGRKTPIAKNIQGQSIKKPTDIQQIASLPGELFFKQRARNVSLWRPICPQNYKSLSDVFQVGDSKPTLSNLACVHQNLLVPARTADMFWEGNVKNGSYRYVLAHIMPQDCEEGEDYGFFRAMKKDDDIEVYTLMRTSGGNSLYSQCTNWVPPTQMVYTTQEPLAEMILSFEDIIVMGGMRQAHLLIKDAAINAQSSQNRSDINICRAKCENNTECRIWSFDMMGAVGKEQDNCYHTFFNSNMSDVMIEYKLGAISQTQDPIEAAESCMLRNSTILYDIAAITLSRDNFTTADCKKSCLGCAVWLHNDSHCVILHEENLQKSRAIVPKLGHSVGFPQCNFGSDFYTYIAQTEDGGREDSMVMEVKEFSMIKSYLILKNKTGRLYLWNPDLTHDGWKVIGQKIDMGTHSHDDKILAARTVTGTPIATPISASIVASVTGYRRHHHEHRGKESNITVWRLVCPERYHSLGDVTLFDRNLNLTNYACIKDRFVANGEIGAKLFSSDGGSIYEIQHRKGEDGTDAGFYSLVMSDTHAGNPVFVLKTAPDGVYYSHGDDNVGVQTTHTVEWKTTTMAADDPVTTYAKSDTTQPVSSKTISTMTAYAERDTTQPATSKTVSTVTSSPAEQTTTVADDTTPRIWTTVSSVVTSPPHSTSASSASTALKALPTQPSTTEATETTERNQGVPMEILPDPDYPLPPDLYADLETFLPGLIVQDLGLWGCFWKHNAVIKGPNATLYNNLDYERCKDACKNNMQCQIWSLAPKDANDVKQGSKCYHVHKDDDITGLEISTMKYAHLGFKCSSAYVGCHTGKSEKDVFHFSGNAADESSCLEKCKDKDYPYSGFQRPNRCTCGNAFDDSLFVRLKKGEKCNLDEKAVCEGCKDNMRYAIHTTGSDDSDHKLCIIGKNVDYLNLEEEYDYEEVRSVLECRSICLTKEEKECWMWSYNYTHCRMIAMSQEMSSFVPCDNCLMGFRTCNEQGKANFVDLPGGGLGAMHNNECATEISFLIAFLVVLALLILALIYICCQRRKKYKEKAEEEMVSQSIRVGSRLDSLDLNWPKKKKTKVDKSHRKAFRRSNLPVLLHLSSKKEKSQVITETGKIEAATDITGKDGVAIMATDNGDNKIATSEKIINDADVHHHAGEGNTSHRDLGSDYITIEGNQGHPHGSSAIQSGHAANSVIMAQYAADSVTGNRIGRGRAMSSVTFNVNQPYHSYDITPRALTLNENNSRKSIVAIQYQPKYNKVTAEQHMSVGSHSAAYHEVKVLGGNNQGNGIHTKQNITSVVEQYGFIPIGADKDFVVKLDSSSGSIA